MSINVGRVVTGTLPYTLDEVKLWLKVDGTDDDTLITKMMSQVVDLTSYILNISIVKQTITLVTSPTYDIHLPYGVVNTITSVKDLEGTDLSYTYDGINHITLLVSDTSFKVVYEAGWDDGTVPPGLVLGLQEVITNLYENRGSANYDSSGDMNINQLIRSNANLQAYNKQSWFK